MSKKEKEMKTGLSGLGTAAQGAAGVTVPGGVSEPGRCRVLVAVPRVVFLTEPAAADLQDAAGDLQPTGSTSWVGTEPFGLAVSALRVSPPGAARCCRSSRGFLPPWLPQPLPWCSERRGLRRQVSLQRCGCSSAAPVSPAEPAGRCLPHASALLQATCCSGASWPWGCAPGTAQWRTSAASVASAGACSSCSRLRHPAPFCACAKNIEHVTSWAQTSVSPLLGLLLCVCFPSRLHSPSVSAFSSLPSFPPGSVFFHPLCGFKSVSGFNKDVFCS
ncbi:uncharacterized protein LOC133629383 [Colius striatus]|uniref:uncharacterized protein LOC133629382 n=1 Tax=Colius striatus TaxID=57412 RepID=UPI002B1E4C47|nr:uncharacterized protein LOC133629382 [Colius striatus]XP_061876027.1 uncharacterized protein LOC133629383 [Colius striatus]